MVKNFCHKNIIIKIRGRPYHPHSQRCVEAYNKEIKRLLEIIYMKSPKKFSFYTALPEALNIYNKNYHSSTKFKTILLFKTEDKKIINEAIKNIKKSQKKFQNSVNSIEIMQNVYYVIILLLKIKVLNLKNFLKKEIFISMYC